MHAAAAGNEFGRKVYCLLRPRSGLRPLRTLRLRRAWRQFHFPSYRAQSEHGAHSEHSEYVAMIVTLLAFIGASTSLVNSQRNENIISLDKYAYINVSMSNK